MSKHPPTANRIRTMFRDTETRLVIPSKEALLGGLMTGGITQLLQSVGGNVSQGVLETVVRSVMSGPLLTLGVTEIWVRGKMVLPKTKGIGSVGQILHLMGSENERITIKFVTDLFPGPVASVLRKLIKITLEQADLVYVVDDLLAVAPCLITVYDIGKVGKLKSAVVGELRLEALPTQTATGLGIILLTFLNTLSLTTINNTITELSQPFKWMGTFVKDKASSR